MSLSRSAFLFHFLLPWFHYWRSQRELLPWMSDEWEGSHCCSTIPLSSSCAGELLWLRRIYAQWKNLYASTRSTHCRLPYLFLSEAVGRSSTPGMEDQGYSSATWTTQRRTLPHVHIKKGPESLLERKSSYYRVFSGFVFPIRNGDPICGLTSLGDLTRVKTLPPLPLIQKPRPK